MMKITNGAKVHQLKDTPYGCMVDVSLRSMRTTRDVYWSPAWERPNGGGSHGGCNSYVAYQLEDQVRIASVNGCGEIRWIITEREVRWALEWQLKTPDPKPWMGDWVEHLGVIEHFGIVVV